MDYFQYQEMFGVHKRENAVLNLIINGLLSIFRQEQDGPGLSILTF